MKLRTLFATAGIGLAAGAAAAVATGFPRRIGATELERSLELPGDDILPDAPIVVDRAITIDAEPEVVWNVLQQLVDEDEEMLICGSVENQSLVLASHDVERELEGTSSDVDATWAFVLTERADGTTRLHLRERQQPHNQRAHIAGWADVTMSSVATMRVLRDVKIVSEMDEELILLEASEAVENAASVPVDVNAVAPQTEDDK